ncbi:hypothetical protein PG999_007838 [Apiospora kogelbergensis]|uniref:C2H2-type domain-containing protein n=1 Tax=Apiospora kogelbergensis TaxID=1337665 RepID=A0AAW0QPM2_9PEZI
MAISKFEITSMHLLLFPHKKRIMYTMCDDCQSVTHSDTSRRHRPEHHRVRPSHSIQAWLPTAQRMPKAPRCSWRPTSVSRLSDDLSTAGQLRHALLHGDYNASMPHCNRGDRAIGHTQDAGSLKIWGFPSIIAWSFVAFHL